MIQALNLQGNPEGSSKDREPVICRAASHPHLAPYCSHLPVAGCSHIRGTNSHGLPCAAHTHLPSQPLEHGWVRRWQKEPSGGRRTEPRGLQVQSGEWQRQPVHAHRTWAWLTLEGKAPEIALPPCRPAWPLQTFIRSQLFSNGCPLFTQGALGGAKLRFAPWVSNCSFHLFSTSSLGLDSLMTTADSISVKAPLSTFLTYSRMPCVWFTNLFYRTFRWEGTEKLSARLLLAVRRWLGRSKETVVSTVFLPCLPPYCTRVFWKLLQVPSFG